MKSKFMKESYKVDRHILECDCTNPDHMLIFEYDMDEAKEYVDMIKVYEPFRLLAVYMTYNNSRGFFGRIRQAFKYIFKKESPFISDDFIFTSRNTEQLQEWIDEVKKYPLTVKKEIIDKAISDEGCNKQKYTKSFHHCVVCDSTDLITFYDSERVGTKLEKYRYKCLDCGVEFEISDAIRI